MIETLAFRTQARTIDHLGREQIADCPTAISELWKNAYDAYARSASLHLFDDANPVAAIFDDGHGMNFDEFFNRWLVIGTQSKYDGATDQKADRNGLLKRTKQGQKGIGRLSSANLGPLLLLVSKRKGQPFVAALIDWRIFENPYLILSDIELPVAQFDNQEDLLDILPELFDGLTSNIWGNTSDPVKADRLKIAWEAYDKLKLDEDPKAAKPSELIVNTIIDAKFEARHLSPWDVWSGKSDHGTALLVSDINYDLRAQLSSIEADGNVDRVRENFFATLSAFTDPYVYVDLDEVNPDEVNPDEVNSDEVNAFDPEFSYEVKTWSNDVCKIIVEDGRDVINRKFTDSLEHVLSGNIDVNGVFRGKVKAFGEWQTTDNGYVIDPPEDYKPPKGPTTVVGPIGLHIATYERNRLNSTHTDEQFNKIGDLAKQHGGFLIFRNGLRVLPYGRLENDFFEIEARRSTSAGVAFFNSQKMFGRVAISRESNPNLRDKAGREGFIDNRSAKALRTIIINILRRVANEYYGQKSDLRGEALADIKKRNKAEKADLERKKLAKKNAKIFRKQLKVNLPILSEIFRSTTEKLSSLNLENAQDIEATQAHINQINSELKKLSLATAPANLGSSEDDYRLFLVVFDKIQDLLKLFVSALEEAILRINPEKPEEIVERQFQNLAALMQCRMSYWKNSISTLQQSERNRVDELFKEKSQEYSGLALPVIEQVKLRRLDLNAGLQRISEIHTSLDNQNEELFQSYLNALELMGESVNIELIASQGVADNIALRDDLNRLNQVAQLGITVEILGHELNSNSRMIREGLRQVKSSGESSGTQLIETGFEALTNQLDFLAPLKVSGTGTRKKITGMEIEKYLNLFFDTAFTSRGISFNPTVEFQNFEIEEQPSRILPVFVNLINNSIYWLVNSHTISPKVQISVFEGKIIVSDNGPGIDPLDQESLFKMFFTRKVSGGRGVGLYLCRVNLMAGGHSIDYITDSHKKQLKGANFLIEFKGANFG